MPQKSLAEICGELSHWLQLIQKQTVPQTSSLLSDIHVLCSTFMMDIHLIKLFTSYLFCFQQMFTMTHAQRPSIYSCGSETWKKTEFMTTAVQSV